MIWFFVQTLFLSSSPSHLVFTVSKFQQLMFGLDDCSEREAWIYSMEFIDLTLVILMIIILVSYLKNKEHIASKSLPKLFSAILALLITESFIIIIHIPWFYKCNPGRSIWSALYFMLAGIQNILVMVIWYYRLYKVFRDSVLKLSKLNRYFFTFLISLYSFMVITSWPVMILHILYAGIWTIYTAFFVYIALFILIVTVISLCGMLIGKLAKTYRYIQAESKLIGIITRIVILTVISLTLTIIQPIVGIWRVLISPNNIHVIYIWHLSVIMDAFSNCLFMILSFPCYDKYSQCFCGFCDQFCAAQWMKM